MIHVRRHKRETAPGKTVTVRAHERDGAGEGVREAPEWARPVTPADFRQAKRAAQRAANRAPTKEESEAASAEWYRLDDEQHGRSADWWDDDAASSEPEPDPKLTHLKDEMRQWRARPEPAPGPDEPMNPELARVLGCDTPEGRAKYDRGRAYREAGYDGPLDADNRIPDPDDQANERTLGILASMRELPSW